MDTDDLSKMVYKAVIVESARLTEDLTLQFGLLSEECSDEEEFLEGCEKVILGLRKLPPEYLCDIFFDDPPEISELQKTLDLILQNIDKIKKHPG